MTQKERMDAGLVYYCNDGNILKEQLGYLEKLYDFNMTRPGESDKRKKMLEDMFAEIGKDCYIEPPFRANWGGKHVHFGNSVYANFNLTLVDDADIYVGDNVMFGPNVTVVTAGHPINAALREKVAQFNAPVRIEKNVWIGAGVIVLPGVTIGENSVIGAGSLVNKDIPANVVAVGTPCRVLREIGERDEKYFFKDKVIDWENL